MRTKEQREVSERVQRPRWREGGRGRGRRKEKGGRRKEEGGRRMEDGGRKRKRQMSLTLTLVSTQALPYIVMNEGMNEW